MRKPTVLEQIQSWPTEKLAKSKAGVLEAGISAPVTATPGCRGEAAILIMYQLGTFVRTRNRALELLCEDTKNYDVRVASLRTAQNKIDACLWMITCCGLVEVDERARAMSAVPADMRDTFLSVLGRR